MEHFRGVWLRPRDCSVDPSPSLRSASGLTMETALVLVVLLPALGALINGARAFASPHAPKNRTVTNAVALGSTFLAAFAAPGIVLGSVGQAWQHVYSTWIPAGLGHTGSFRANFAFDFAFRID